MTVFLLLLTTVLVVVVNGRPDLADEQELLDTATTTIHCRTTVQVFYPSEEGKLLYPVCSSRCPRGSELWFDGVGFNRLPELVEYGLMVEMIYINGSLQDCKMVPYETREEATARQEDQKRRVISCSSIVDASQDETLVLSHTERIPSTPPSSPIHKRLEGFSRWENSSNLYMISPEAMSLQDAVQYCESYGSNLATVEPSQERKLLKGRLTNGVWTSRDILAEENFAQAGSTPTTHSNVLCEHPLMDDSNQYTCPKGYWKYKSSCYVASSERYTYSAGEKFCSDLGTYPVFINSQDEHDFLSKKISFYSWIGITDMDVEGTFISKRFGLPLFFRWGPNEPNDRSDEDCVTIDNHNSFLWNDVPCNFIVRMLCEVSAEIAD